MRNDTTPREHNTRRWIKSDPCGIHRKGQKLSPSIYLCCIHGTRPVPVFLSTTFNGMASRGRSRDLQFYRAKSCPSVAPSRRRSVDNISGCGTPPRVHRELARPTAITADLINLTFLCLPFCFLSLPPSASLYVIVYSTSFWLLLLVTAHFCMIQKKIQIITMELTNNIAAWTGNLM